MTTDSELLLRSLDDPIVFEEIFERHYSAIRNYVARRLSPAWGDDIAAEAFCIAFDQRRRLVSERPDCPVGAWLFGVATNLVRRHHRDERRQLRAYARLDSGLAAIESGDDTDGRLDARRAAPAVARALASLSADERDVLLLYTWSDLDYQGVADALGVPVGTVRSRLARARRRASRHLGDRAPGADPALLKIHTPVPEKEAPSCATSN